jgi:hypothetical protein
MLAVPQIGPLSPGPAFTAKLRRDIDMEQHSDFRPFWTGQSAYQTYWLSTAPGEARSGWFKRLRGALSAFVVAPIRAHMAAAAVARRHRLSLDEM